MRLPLGIGGAMNAPLSYARGVYPFRFDGNNPADRDLRSIE
jgi:hypothetical protein